MACSWHPALIGLNICSALLALLEKLHEIGRTSRAWKRYFKADSDKEVISGFVQEFCELRADFTVGSISSIIFLIIYSARSWKQFSTHGYICKQCIAIF